MSALGQKQLATCPSPTRTALLDSRVMESLRHSIARISGGVWFQDADPRQLARLLGAGHEWPNGGCANNFDKISPPHCSPRCSGQGIVTIPTSTLEGECQVVLNVRLDQKADICVRKTSFIVAGR